MSQRNFIELARAIERSTGIDDNAKINLAALLAGLKRSTYVLVEGDDRKFSRLLTGCGFIYARRGPLEYQQLERVKGTSLIWKTRRDAYGYDIFANASAQKSFDRYVEIISQDEKAASKISGELYGYPKCCIRAFLKEHHTKAIMPSYFDYFSRLHTCDELFPYISHSPCSTKCKPTAKLNKKIESEVKYRMPAFYRRYEMKHSKSATLIVDSRNDISQLRWKKIDGNDYTLIPRKPIGKKMMLINYLTKERYDQGDILEAKIVLKNDYVKVLSPKKIGHIRLSHLH